MEKNNAKFVLILYPKGSDISLNSFFSKISEANFAALSKMLDMHHIPNFNITPGVKNKLQGMAKQDYTYEHDGHFRPSGYLLMAKLTADSLLASGIIKPGHKEVTK